MIIKESAGANKETYFPSLYPTSGAAKRAISVVKKTDLSSTNEYINANLPLSGDSSNGPSSRQFNWFRLSSFGLPGNPLTEKSNIADTKNKNSIAEIVFFMS